MNLLLGTDSGCTCTFSQQNLKAPPTSTHSPAWEPRPGQGCPLGPSSHVPGFLNLSRSVLSGVHPIIADELLSVPLAPLLSSVLLVSSDDFGPRGFGGVRFHSHHPFSILAAHMFPGPAPVGRSVRVCLRIPRAPGSLCLQPKIRGT